MKPSPFDLFIRYHLGLNGDYQPRFYNLSTLATEFGVQSDQVATWLKEASLSTDITGYVDYSLPRAHGRAQMLSLDGRLDDTRSFARKTFGEFMEALATWDPTRFRHGVDWDAVWDYNDDDLKPSKG